MVGYLKQESSLAFAMEGKLDGFKSLKSLVIFGTIFKVFELILALTIYLI